jgi:hypothetical protein
MPTKEELETHLAAKANSGNGGGERKPPSTGKEAVGSSGGYTPFPNHIVEAMLKEEMTGAEMKLFLWVHRHAYGNFHYKFVKYSGEKASDATNYSRRQMDRAYSSLKARGMLRFKNDDEKKRYVQINFLKRDWKQPQ